LVTSPTRIPAAEWASRVADGAALCLGVVCGVAAFAALGGAFSARLDLLAQLSAVWLLGSSVVAVYGLLLAARSRRTLLTGVGLAGMLACAPPILPELARPIRPPALAGRGYRIKLIEYNAWGRNANIGADVGWLARQNPDFILMTDTTEPAKAALAARGFICVGGVADSAIFSRMARGREPYAMPWEWPLLPSFSRATFSAPNGPFTIVATHFKRPTAGGQLEQRLALLQLLDQYDRRRLIVAGDFNATPWSFALRRLDQEIGLERRDRAMFSWPALDAPIAFLPIDHVYAGEAWRTVAIQRGPRLSSDHYPLVVTLALEG
jgi:endonuclease/exonuclease/phosphatase (EEP) superfamily protein YafD